MDESSSASPSASGSPPRTDWDRRDDRDLWKVILFARGAGGPDGVGVLADIVGFRRRFFNGPPELDIVGCGEGESIGEGAISAFSVSLSRSDAFLACIQEPAAKTLGVATALLTVTS